MNIIQWDENIYKKKSIFEVTWNTSKDFDKRMYRGRKGLVTTPVKSEEAQSLEIRDKGVETFHRFKINTRRDVVADF